MIDLAINAPVGLHSEEPELAPVVEPASVGGLAGRRDVVPDEEGERAEVDVRQ